MSKFLTMNRPTTVSKLISLVPQHSGALPREIIPQWADLLPSSKLPNRCCPVHEFEFSRDDLAHPVWEFSKAHGFDLQDPYNRIVHRYYDPLHDKHLHLYWTKVLKKNLKRLGQINNDGRVICTLQEFNQYRAFLYLEYRTKLLQELLQMDHAKEIGDHCVNVQNHLKLVEDFNEKVAVRRKRAEDIFAQRMKSWKRTIQNYDHQMLKIKKDHDHQKTLVLLKGHQRDLKTSRRYFQLLALRKRRILVLKRKLRENDNLLQERLTNHKQRKLEIRTKMTMERYRLHYMAYLRERNEKKQVLEAFLVQMNNKVQDRKDMYQRQHRALEQELVRRKTKNVTKKYERRSKNALVKALLKECKKSIWAKSYGRTASMVQQTIERAINAAYAIHTTISPTTSSTQIIDTASQFVLDLRDTPNEPLPRDRLIMAYVVGQLRKIMDEIVQTTVHDACKLIEQAAIRKTENFDKEEYAIRSSLSSHGSFTKMATFQSRSDRTQSRVSMGPVSIVEQYETDSFSLKKCKFRPPTPVTSVTSLVECTFRESDVERSSISNLEVTTETALGIIQRIHSEDYPLIHVMHSQRRYLEGNLLKYRMIVQPYVEQRLLAAIDLDRLTVAGYEDFCTGAAEREKILQRAASSLLRFPEDEHIYAVALFDSVHLLTALAIRKVKQILNAS